MFKHKSPKIISISHKNTLSIIKFCKLYLIGELIYAMCIGDSTSVTFDTFFCAKNCFRFRQLRENMLSDCIFDSVKLAAWWAIIRTRYLSGDWTMKTSSHWNYHETLNEPPNWLGERDNREQRQISVRLRLALNPVHIIDGLYSRDKTILAMRGRYHLAFFFFTVYLLRFYIYTRENNESANGKEEKLK